MPRLLKSVRTALALSTNATTFKMSTIDSLTPPTEHVKPTVRQLVLRAQVVGANQLLASAASCSTGASATAVEYIGGLIQTQKRARTKQAFTITLRNQARSDSTILTWLTFTKSRAIGHA